jgi:hypothetical protein
MFINLQTELAKKLKIFVSEIQIQGYIYICKCDALLDEVECIQKEK